MTCHYVQCIIEFLKFFHVFDLFYCLASQLWNIQTKREYPNRNYTKDFMIIPLLLMFKNGERRARAFDLLFYTNF